MNLDDAEFAKEEFREKWDKKYPNILKSWDRNWNELTTFFEYPPEIRKIIYTTNAVESYHEPDSLNMSRAIKLIFLYVCLRVI